MVPICCKCQVTMRCAKNEFIVRDPAAVGAGGVFNSTYWSGDQYKCPVCGHEIVVGFGTSITAEKAKELGWDKEAMEFNYKPPTKPVEPLYR